VEDDAKRVPHASSPPGIAVLTKPFPVKTTAARIRSMIDTGKEWL